MTTELNGYADFELLPDGDLRVIIDARNKLSAETVDSLKSHYNGRFVDIRLKRHNPPRSLQANAYAWTLIDRLSEVLRIPKEDIYRQHIREIGGVSDILRISAQALPAFRRAWEEGHIGQMVEVLDETDNMVSIICWHGSSTYDSIQMSHLIDSLVADCADYGIPTLESEEIERIKGEWTNE